MSSAITPNTATAIALDLGTTAIKVGLLDADGNLYSVLSRPAPLLAHADGRYEGDALAYAEAADSVLHACRAGAGALPFGLCSQRSSFLVWRCSDGMPVTPMISWQDTRGAKSCEALRPQAPRIEMLSGLRLTPYYFAPKLRVLLAEQPDLRAGLENGELRAGTLDSYLIWRWSGGRHFITDASMAARTLLMELSTRRWSLELCTLFSIPHSILPQIMPSSGLALALNNGLTLHASLGDQSAAFLAGAGRNSADVLVNLGSGGFVLRALAPGQAPMPGYLRTLISDEGGAEALLALEGTLNSLAAALASWPVGEVTAADLGQNDIFCLAEPSGMGAPYFREDLGLLFSTPVDDLAPREVAALLLEGIIFRVVDMLDALQRTAPIGRILLAGGLSHVSALRDGIAQCAPAPVVLLTEKNASLLGVALAAVGRREARQEFEGVKAMAAGDALRMKYARWQQWLADLLRGG